jgi:hypothetical protein
VSSEVGIVRSKIFPLKKSQIELTVVKKWVEFWRWQSKVVGNKWQEMN